MMWKDKYFIIYMTALIVIIGCIVNSCTQKLPDHVYHNMFLKVVSVQEPTHWRHGKYHGVDKRWLLQDLKDTTLYCEWAYMKDSTYFSTLVGDTVHFDYIRKDRFFHIKYRKKWKQRSTSVNATLNQNQE